jgi:hypothetical protein
VEEIIKTLIIPVYVGVPYLKLEREILQEDTFNGTIVRERSFL